MEEEYRGVIYIDGEPINACRYNGIDYDKFLPLMKMFASDLYTGTNQVEIRIYFGKMWFSKYTAYHTKAGNVGWKSKTIMSIDFKDED